MQNRKRHRIDVVAILASAGGVFSVSEILSRLPRNFPLPILYHQRITVSKAKALAHTLMLQTDLKVVWAKAGEELSGGRVYLCPPGFSMEVKEGIIALERLDGDGKFMHPARLISSLISCYENRCALVLLNDVTIEAGAGLLQRFGKKGLLLNQLPARGVKGAPGEGPHGLMLPLEEIAPSMMSLVAKNFAYPDEWAVGQEESVSAKRSDDLKQFLNNLLNLVLVLHDTRMGNIQLFDVKTGELRIVVQRGFQSDFLQHFWAVTAEDNSVCGRAIRARKTVVIPDVLRDELFTPHVPIAVSAGFRAVQSTPLITSKGTLIGVLSTHFPEFRSFSPSKLRLLKLYAGMAADYIERFTFTRLSSVRNPVRR
ncbi:MAG TPA: chemotaxis protein CheB [Chryseosolibacter sp.]|nr:chemotaxis protein CheB [Chryseosolibacter sp.]